MDVARDESAKDLPYWKALGYLFRGMPSTSDVFDGALYLPLGPGGQIRVTRVRIVDAKVARAQIASIAVGVSDIAMVERQPSLEGRTMFIILGRGRSQLP